MFNWNDFMNDFPYTNFSDINVSWFLNKFKQVFDDWEGLYNQMLSWKTATDEYNATWRAQQEQAFTTWENNFQTAIDAWKVQTETDIGTWETDTIANLEAWKAVFINQYNALKAEVEQIAEDAETAKNNAQASATSAQASADSASATALALQASLQQIDTNTSDITTLKTQVNNLDDDMYGSYTKNYIDGKNLTASSALEHAIVDNPDTCISDYIPVTWGTNQFGYIYTNDNTDATSYQIWYLNSEKEFIDYKGRNPLGENSRNNLTVPENTAYVIFSFKKGFNGKVTSNDYSTDYYIATDTLTEYGLIEKIGDLNNLNTTEKTNVVGAVNEVFNDANKHNSSFEDSEIINTTVYTDSELNWTDGVKYYDGRHLTGGSYDNYHFCFFDVVEGDIISTETSTFRDRCEFYNDTVVSSSNLTGFASYTVPTGVNRVALTRYKYNDSNITFQRKSTQEVVTTDALKNVDNALKESTTLLDNVLLNLPNKIYAVTGFELNIYFENIVEKWHEYEWNVICGKGMQLERGFRVTPQNNDAGTYPLTIEIRKGNSVKAVTSTLVISSSTSGSGNSVSVIILGDSTTYNGTVIEKLHEDFNGDVMTLSTLGTMGTSPNNHEGRSGWTLNDYFTKASITYPEGDPRGTIYNPFYNPNTQTFDASYYFTNSGVSIPTWFIINMGINDMFGYTSDSALDSQIETCVGYLESMIDSIHAVSNAIKIGVCVTIPPNDSQDAFGKAYACGQTRDRYKRNNTIWANRIIEEFGNMENSGVFIIPIHTNLDTVYNMGLESIPVNARNTETYQSAIGNGGVHPVTSGYWQIADVYTAFLKGNAR